MYNAYPDKFVSAVTGREYPFVKTPDGSSKRNALFDLQRDNAEAKAAMAKRLGREPTNRELVFGAKLPDTRTIPERVIQDSAVTSQAKPDPNRNPYAVGVATCAEAIEQAQTQAQRFQAKQRLRSMQQAAEKWEADHATELEHEARRNDPQAQTAIADGVAWLGRLQFDPAVPEQWVNAARERLESIKQTGDHAAYWAATQAFEAEREAVLTDKAQALERQAAALKAEAATVKAETAIKSSGV